MNGGYLSLATHAVLRVAAWPVETTADFTADGSGALRALVDECAALDRIDVGLLATGRALADRVHDAVPLVVDPATRRRLLALRRQLHRGSGPLDPVPADGVPADLRVVLDEAAAARHAHADRNRALAQRYDDALRGELDALYERAGEDRFRLALLVANDAVATQWDRRRELATGSTRPKARVRRLEGTVLHHLLRSCGRPTPNGLFAGIVPVEPGPGPLRAAPVARERVAVAPDLGPFVDALDRWRPVLAHDPDVPARINPTLHRQAGDWVWHVAGTLGWQRAAGDRLPLDALSAWPEVDEQGRQRLAAVGLVEPAVDLDVAAGDPWSVLERVGGSLPGELGARWRRSVDACRQACQDLHDAVVATDVDAARAALGCVRRAIEPLGVPVEGVVARVDLRLAWQAGWNDDDRLAVAGVIGHALAWYAADGAAEVYRRARLARAATPGAPRGLLAAAAHHPGTATPTPIEPTRVGALAAAGVADVATEGAWSERLLAAGAGQVIDVPGAPGRPRVPPGCGPVGTVALAPGATWWVRWSRPQPGMVSSRFAPLLPSAMVDEHLTLIDDHQGIQLVGAHHPNPSAAVRAAAPARLGRTSSTVLLDEVEVRVDDAAGVRLHPGDRVAERGRVPVYDSASAITPADPVGRYVGALAMANGWELLNYGFPLLPGELASGHLPAVTVRRADSAVRLSAERWTIPGDTVADLAGRDDLDRYRAWRAWCRGRGVPPLVLLRWEPTPGAAEYLFPTESVLAVRSLFDHLPVGAGPLVAVALPDDGDDAGWPVRDAHGRRHLAELVVTWWRDDD